MRQIVWCAGLVSVLFFSTAAASTGVQQSVAFAMSAATPATGSVGVLRQPAGSSGGAERDDPTRDDKSTVLPNATATRTHLVTPTATESAEQDDETPVPGSTPTDEDGTPAPVVTSAPSATATPAGTLGPPTTTPDPSSGELYVGGLTLLALSAGIRLRRRRRRLR